MEKKLIVGFFLLCLNRCLGDSFGHKIGVNKSTRIFSPRMDYDEWTPLGRGDPLKNDPTFDYVPPVLDRVQYWLGDTQSTTESSSKRDVLVLGVTAKKTSPKIPEHYLKFMDAPKYHQDGQPHSSYLRNDFTGSTGAEPPKMIRTTKFRGGAPSMDFRLNKGNHYHTGYQGNDASYYSEKPRPYTMMLPPPVAPSSDLKFANLAPNLTKKSSYDHTTPSSVSFEKSNLIYQSSQALDWPSASPPQRPAPHNPPLLTWPSKEDDQFEVDHHQAASMNHEVVVGQNANIIVDAGDSDEDKEEIVLGQKPSMQVILANATSTTGDYEDQKNVTVSVVMPTNYKESTTKSSFTKPSTRTVPQFVAMSSVTPPFVSSTTMIPPAMEVAWQQDQAPPPLMPVRFPPKIHLRPGLSHRPFGMPKPMGVVLMAEGFRPTTQRASPLGAILKKEEGVREVVMTTTTATTTTTTTTTTTPATTTTTSVGDSFTTDPIFSHYKQPPAPLHGPMYLIIQGHSKVKTYKPIVNKHGVPVETTSRPMSKFEQFVNENTRRGVETKTTTEKIEESANGTKSGPDSLVNLVEKGFSAFTIPED